MKSICLIAVFTFIITGILFPQNSEQDTNKLVDTNYCIFLNNKVFKHENGVITKIEKQLLLNNGTVINADGSYVLKNLKKMKLKDGECLGFSGKHYKSLEKLNSTMLKQYKKDNK